MENLSVGSVYTFNTLAPALLGAIFKNATLLGIVDYTTACRFINVDLMQRKIYPLLPPGTLDNPKKYQYLLVATESGNNTVVAYQWLDPSTIQQITSVTVVVTLPNRSSSDTVAIRDALALLGFTGFTIEVK